MTKYRYCICMCEVLLIPEVGFLHMPSCCPHQQGWPSGHLATIWSKVSIGPGFRNQKFSTVVSQTSDKMGWEVDAEHPYMYGPGGFCPIEPGDRIANRFVVLHKLGYGGFATVWLVRDEKRRMAATSP